MSPCGQPSQALQAAGDVEEDLGDLGNWKSLYLLSAALLCSELWGGMVGLVVKLGQEVLLAHESRHWANRWTRG